MADVFLSYHPGDYVAARAVVSSVRRAGLTVWFEDFSYYPEREYHRVSRELASASVVVVLWSFRSVNEEWVRQQAREAIDKGRLLSVLVERVELPMPFSECQAVDLTEGTYLHFENLVALIQASTERARRELRDTEPEAPSDATDRPAARAMPAKLAMEPWEPVPYPHSEPATDGARQSDLANPGRTMVAVNAPNVIGTALRTIRAYLYSKVDEGEVKEDADRLRDNADVQHTSGQATVSKIRAGTLITVILDFPDIDCHPRTRRFIWRGHWQKTDFTVRYLRKEHSRKEGNISWFAGVVCIAQLPLNLRLTDEYEKRSSSSTKTAPGYEAVFVSYSTEDSAIVDLLETTYTALGMTYLRDIRALRSGETWDKRLLQLIQRADLFQLCWSTNAKKSAHVTDEWRFALTVQKPNFIRPCYWEDPMPEPPLELRNVHFTRLKVNWFARTWFRLRARFG